MSQVAAFDDSPLGRGRRNRKYDYCRQSLSYREFIHRRCQPHLVIIRSSEIRVQSGTCPATRLNTCAMELSEQQMVLSAMWLAQIATCQECNCTPIVCTHWFSISIRRRSTNGRLIQANERGSANFYRIVSIFIRI